MFKKIALVFFSLVVILVIIIALQPKDFTVTRSATVAAPPERVFAQVNDFRAWEAWSPWAKMDPAAKNEFGGPPAGEGSTFAWSGNDQVGEGKMTIVESKPAERVGIRLDFVKPFACTNQTLFTFKPEGAGTAVTWSMSGEKNFFAKAFGLFMDMDEMVGSDFEKGLASMKAAAEGAGPATAAAATAPATAPSAAAK
jgi:uncharacterized protein YndB with AHSA1/START domain